MGDVAAHVADGGDAVGNQEREDEFAAAGWFSCARQVDVHVGEAGDEEFSCGVDWSGAGGDFEGGVWADGEDFFVIDQDGGVWLWRCASGVDYGGVDDGNGGGVGFVACGREEKKQKEDLENGPIGVTHIRIVAEECVQKRQQSCRTPKASLLEAVVFFQDGAELVMGEGGDAVAVNAGHGVGGDYGVDDGFFGGLDYGGENWVEVGIREHF